MSALQVLEVRIVEGEHERRHREQLEILGRERRVGVRDRQGVVRLAPGGPLVSGAASLELA